MSLAGLTCPGTSFMRIALIASLLMLLPGPASSQTIPIRLYAAGSLRVALTEVARDFEAHGGGRYKVEPTFGASGLLREKIEAGELAHVFASADTGHPSKLAEQGRTVAPTTIFARNELCAIVRSGIEASPKSLLDVLLDPKVRVGISTPKADPSGDYAIAVFNKAEALRTGSKAVLEAKAVQLTGAPSSRKAPEGRNLYGWLMELGAGRRVPDLLHQRGARQGRSTDAGNRYHTERDWCRRQLRSRRDERGAVGGLGTC